MGASERAVSEHPWRRDRRARDERDSNSVPRTLHVGSTEQQPEKPKSKPKTRLDEQPWGRGAVLSARGLFEALE
eukprot:5759270-Alexandrium_andersonii.AAC.1